MSFFDMPSGVAVTFTEDGQQTPIGRSRKYADETKLFDILKAARAPLEAHQAVATALQMQRPGRVSLDLTPDQYHRLKFGR